MKASPVDEDIATAARAILEEKMTMIAALVVYVNIQLTVKSFASYSMTYGPMGIGVEINIVW